MLRHIITALVCASSMTFVSCKNSSEFSGRDSSVIFNTSSDTSSQKSKPQQQQPLKPKLVEQEFNSSTSHSLTASTGRDGAVVESEINPASNTSSMSRETRQIQRADFTKSFTQGSSGNAALELFEQTSIGTSGGLLDIIIVVDDSSSMDDEQELIADKMPELLSHLDGTNWRIALQSTTPIETPFDDAPRRTKCLHAIIDHTDTDPEGRFRAAFDRRAPRPAGYPAFFGTDGSGIEAGIEGAILGLKCKDSSQNGWLRDDSSVAVLIITDEQNCGDDRDDQAICRYRYGQQLIDALNNELNRPVGVKSRVYGLLDIGSSKYPSQYVHAIRNSGGLFRDIEDEDSYAVTFTDISEDISDILISQFELNAIPDSSSIVVNVIDDAGRVIPQSAPNDYTVSGKTITFNGNRIPVLGSKVRINYTTGASPIVKSFDLEQVPLEGSVEVLVNANPNTETLYPYNIVGQKVEFINNPPESSSITVRAKENTPLLKVFNVVSGLNSNNVTPEELSIDDVVSSDFSYDAASGNLTLGTAPAEYALIKLKFSYNTGLVRTYKIPALEDGAFDVVLRDKDTDEAIDDFEISDDNLTIGDGVSLADRSFLFSYKLGEQEFRTIKIPRLSSITSVTFDKEGILCDPKLEEQELVFDSCDLPSNEDISVQLNIETKNLVFQVDGVDKPEAGNWSVFIDGEETSNYSRSGSTVHIDDEHLPFQSIVRIRYQRD